MTFLPSRAFGTFFLWLLLAPASLRADPEPSNSFNDKQPAAPAEAPKGFFQRDSPLPDPGGLRAKLAALGIVPGLIYTGEEFGNPAGGYRQGAVYNGLLTAGLDVDFGKLLGWDGLKFHALTYESHGANGTNLYTSIPASTPTTASGCPRFGCKSRFSTTRSTCASARRK